MPKSIDKERAKNPRITLINNMPHISLYNFSFKCGVDMRTLLKYCVDGPYKELLIKITKRQNMSVSYISLDEIERYLKEIKPKLLELLKLQNKLSIKKANEAKEITTIDNRSQKRDRGFQQKVERFLHPDNMTQIQYARYLGIRIT